MKELFVLGLRWSMNSIYNQKYEIAMRVLLLLSVSDKPMSIDTIASLDLMITYGKYFQLTDSNLHGENSYYFSELSARRNLIKNALPYLVITGLIEICDSKKGLEYNSSPNGITIAKNIKTNYGNEYLEIAKEVMSKTKGLSDNQIIKNIIQFKNRK